jgi:hypothetical protein
VPVAGDVFTIVTAASVTGTFDGLSQNSLIALNGRGLMLSYGPTTVTLTETMVTGTPTIAWPTPAPIVYGTALDTTQLDATASFDGASVQGTYSYAIGAGSVLSAGSSQTLTVHFEPTDSVNFRPATGTTTIDVLAAPLTVAVNSATRFFGQANPSFTVTYSGFAPGDGPGTLSGALAFSTNAARGSSVGKYTVQVDGLSSKNYAVKYVPGVLSIVPVELTFTAVNKVKRVKAPIPRLTFTEAGFLPGQSAHKVFKGAPRLFTTASRHRLIGQYPIVVTRGSLRLINTNYTFKFVSGILKIV